MAQNHICKGEVLDWVNTGEDTVFSGAPVVVGSILGVATVDIPAGKSGVVSISEVWELPKAAVAVAQGAPLYFDKDGDPAGGVVGSGALTPTAADITAGFAYEAAAAADATVKIILAA